MMVFVYGFIFACAGYLLGAIPVGVIIARSHGVDIFKFGSGNPGATNVKRACGKFAGNLCFVLDAIKGFIAAFLPVLALEFGADIGGELAIFKIVGFVTALIGHIFPIFTRFRGGKGVSVTIGALAAFMWAAILIGLVIWVAVFYSTKYVSVASIVMALSLPVSSALIYGANDVLTYLAIFVAIIVVFKHISNIKRLLNGTESRFK